MPSKNNDDLAPDYLPVHAQDIYRSTFDSAWDQYKDPEDRLGDASREETAHKVAWAAVKKVYRKNEQGRWVEK